MDVRVVLRDRVGDLLQQDRLARLRLRHDEPALPLPDGAEEVHDPRRVLVGVGFEVQRLLGEERREVVEVHALDDGVGLAVVDGVDADEGEEALPLFRRADLAVDGVAFLEAEPLDLRGRDVDVVGGGEVVELGRAEEAVAVGQDFEHADLAEHPFERRLRGVEVVHVGRVRIRQGLPAAVGAPPALGAARALLPGRHRGFAPRLALARPRRTLGPFRRARLRVGAGAPEAARRARPLGHVLVTVGIGLGVGFEDLVDQVLFAEMRVVLDVEVPSDPLQLGDFFTLEGSDVHERGRVPTAGGNREGTRRGRAQGEGRIRREGRARRAPRRRSGAIR